MTPRNRRDADGYADLRSYAAIGDGRTVALVATDGRVDWLPLPQVDSPPPFAALLDAEHGGWFALRPVEDFTVERRYVDGTNVLTTTFRTATGSVRVTDSLNTGVAGRLPWAELARRVVGVEGEVELTGELRPGTCLNTAAPWIADSAAGPVVRVDRLTMALRTSAVEVRTGERAATFTLRTAPESRHLVALVATEAEPLFLPEPDDIDAGIDRTAQNWSIWLRTFGWDGPWQEEVSRSALALKLLIQASTGAVMAAATTSLPESPAGGKNWDYRYAWVRDMAYSLTALFRFGLREEVQAAISWLLATIREHGPDPRVFYASDGSVPTADVVERDVPGWRGIGPVLTGNRAGGQLQLGVFGDLFSIVRLYVDNGNVLDEATGRLLAGVADTACDAWRSKDSGMWELPEERHYTTSKLGCWQALTSAVHLAEQGEIAGDPGRWRTEAELIRRWVDEHCWSAERNAYVWYPGSEQLDASILLHAISGFDRGERMSATLDALRAELGAGPHLYRFSGAQREEGAFVACSFWLASALHLCGRRDEARTLLDELLATTPNDVGLLAEMIDPGTGDWLGNLPQALSHLALIHAAITLADEPSVADAGGGT
ncbi:Glucoamylase (glucan-1,4-alpha-glucosidase), GH15 family [Jatrophihabitans endophyticus]|uniref:Glucoamylase (Glucan-1,4-alpha-glucosidase), GH15 family n=1 Tax=Jatrophihabitans endophyticus TaxID=1206085 RepID=A0A1M5Q8K1_9ACTN|nr:glycoside hydrolase family 15 protein [Jatrophihabitans endophyticus]SHH10332.1 Glucoamylase (glucan-1,4-alpha-glucosidase), GH15 family [Jatrophihabitans endophyticus]